MPLAPSSTHQEKQQQRQLAAVVPGAGDPMASHVGVKADTVGVFHPERYVRGQPCVEVVGSPPAGMARAAFITCSQFEKASAVWRGPACNLMRARVCCKGTIASMAVLV